MLLRIDERYPHKRKKLVAILSCDVCKCIFERAPAKIKKQTFHFCSKMCMTTSLRVGGSLYDKRIFSTREKYGVDHISQLESVKDNKKQSSLAKFGCENPLQSESVKEKSRQTCVVKYGVEYPMQNENIMAKRMETSMKRYGTAFPFEREDIRQKAAVTNIELFGFAVPIHSPKIREATDWSEQKAKEHETKKRNGTYTKQSSCEEERMYELLCERFGANDITRNRLMNNLWSIDFYITSIDTFIQYDGVYGHGLDRPIEEIALHKTKRDVAIHAQVDRDKRQNEWFLDQKLRLVRIKGTRVKNLSQTTLDEAL